MNKKHQLKLIANAPKGIKFYLKKPLNKKIEKKIKMFMFVLNINKNHN